MTGAPKRAEERIEKGVQMSRSGIVVTLRVSAVVCLSAPVAQATCTLADVSPLTITKSGAADASLLWTEDPAASGYSVYRVDDKTLLATVDQEPVHIAVPVPTALPVLDPGALPAAAGTLLYYRVLHDCVCTDSDGDRLCDAVETNTLVFVDATDTGTDPNVADTDGDAIDDGDEVLGTADGLDLPAMGAHPLRRDIFIEYDWFDDDRDCAFHSHQPTAAMVDLVSASFADAPVFNADGSSGIRVHHDYGQGGAFTGGNFIDDPDGVIAGHVGGSEFRDYKAANFAAERHGYFHWCLLPHRYDTSSGSSGYAEIDGDDFIVSLYCAFSTQNVANTIQHELGHNLNLRHGGFENCNWKPNFNSVMNYKYQFPGVDSDCDPPGDGVLDYSRGTRVTLDENRLNEFLGTCGGPAVDWNGNTNIENPVTYDVNRDFGGNPQNGGCGGNLTELRDHNDWRNLVYSGILDPDTPPELVECENRPPGW